MEEAKKNMYAFSTTTYTGFQCTIDEETSEKFKGELVMKKNFNQIQTSWSKCICLHVISHVNISQVCQEFSGFCLTPT